jgi:MFS family permease
LAPSRASGGIAARSVLQVLGDQRRVVLTLGTAALLLCAMRASRQVVIPLWAEHLGLSPSLISIIFGLVAAVDMSVFYPAGKVMDTRGRLWVVLPSALLMAASFIAIPMTTGTMSFLLVALVLGFGNGIGAGAVMTLGADAAPQAIRMQFLGIWRVTNDIGSCAGPVLLSLLTATASLGVASFGTGLLGLAAAAAFWRWVPRRLE